MTLDTVLQGIGLILAFIGLFTGAAGGVYYGAIRRTRLDDRREILREGYVKRLLNRENYHFTAEDRDWCSEVNLRGPAYIHYEYAVSFEQMVDDMQAIDDIVRLLPWKDRALWRATRPVLQTATFADIEVAIRLGNVRAFRQFRNVNMTDILIPTHALEPLFRRSSDQSEYWTNFDDALSRFEKHLVRNINPHLGARLAELKLTTELWVNGPHKWSRSVRLSKWQDVRWDVYRDYLSTEVSGASSRS